jgi:hypothetical protein
MKCLAILPIFMMLSFNVVLAEGPPVEWEKTFGGSDDDFAYSVRQTTDGGYIIAGSTCPSWNICDVYLIKTDAGGNIVWEKTFSRSEVDEARSVRQTTDGGYIIAGVTGYVNMIWEYIYDVYLIKTDANGNIVWEKTFGPGGYSNGARSVQQTTDGGYIVAGSTQTSWLTSDVYLIKTDANGNSVWEKTFSRGRADWACSVQQTTDGGYIIAGYTNGAVYLVKTDANGNSVWEKTFGGSMDIAYSVQQTTDGGYIIAGSIADWDDVYLIKTDADGNIIWEKTFGRSDEDQAYSVRQTTDGGYIIAGYTLSYEAGRTDVYLIKTDAGGNIVWEKTFGGSNNDFAYSVRQTTDGGYIIAGYTSSYGADYDVYLIKVSADCLNQPRSDLTGDCKTDFRDFAVMASEWLDCGQYDPNDCL